MFMNFDCGLIDFAVLGLAVFLVALLTDLSPFYLDSTGISNKDAFKLILPILDLAILF